MKSALKYVLRGSVLISLGFLLALQAVTLIPTQTNAATIDSANVKGWVGSTQYTMTNYSQTVAYLSAYCSYYGPERAAVVAAYPSNVAFDEATGKMTYTANVVWRSCDSSNATRAFAVTGYPASGGAPATCPDAGTYASSHTYDCIKYTDSDAGHFGGFAALACPSGINYQCVTGGSSAGGLFVSVVERIQKGPSTSPQISSQGMSGTVPNWSTATLTSGSHLFYRANGFCSWYKYDTSVPGYGGSTSSDHGTGNCVSLSIKVSWIRYNYTLTPSISGVVDNSVVQPNSGDYPLLGTVRNNGPTDSKPNTNWQITQLRYDPGVAISNRDGGDNGADPCGYFSGATECSPLRSEVEPDAYVASNIKDYSIITNIQSWAIGTRLCFAMSVQPYTHTSSDWRHSALKCVIVAKAPKVQVIGGDLIVGRGSETASEVSTSLTRSGGLYYGSWIEYGLFASGQVSGMASGSSYVGGAVSPNLCMHRALTFTNQAGFDDACLVADIGGYSFTRSKPSIATAFPVSSDTPTIGDEFDVATGQGVYTSTLDELRLQSSAAIGEVTPGQGRLVVIHAPSTTVFITNNIEYTSGASMNALRAIPQVLIIAENIIIADNVSRVDAWLMATGTGSNGTINTCAVGGSDATIPVHAGLCTTQLTVNGPVIANHLLLRRTAGSEVAAPGAPAEVFNLRPDAYLWALQHGADAGRITTASTKELPPRF